MARKAQVTAMNEIEEGVLKSILLRTESLYRKHAAAISRVRNESDEKKVSVGFGVLIDCSDSTPKVRTRIRYSETVTDELIDSLEDPLQPTLFDPELGKAQARAGRKTAAEGNED